MGRKYAYLKIRLASPEEIRKWSFGEVVNAETINYRTLKPERGGLFAEEIFGPTKDYQCACTQKSKKNLTIESKKCPVCGVEITESRVRRERMGHIDLGTPVVHSWYLKSTPSKLALLLDMKASDLELVVRYASRVVINVGDTSRIPELHLEEKQVLSDPEYYDAVRLCEENGCHFEALKGGEAVKRLLQKLNLDEEIEKLRKELKTASKQSRVKVAKRLDVVEAFKNSDNKPEWMVLDVLPVIPADLRPMVPLDGGRFATTGLNDLYRTIINRNIRLKDDKNKSAPELIINNEKRLLQDAVDDLIDNSKSRRKSAQDRNHPKKGLSDQLRGKQGRFRQNLLGKRVDYSGRSVIVVGPNLEMHQCGVPREMALTLFKPFVVCELIKSEKAKNTKDAKNLIDRKDESIWDSLETVVREHPVLLNRAPTLHRLGIQAFEPILIDGKAIQLHPLACPAFNADFDGDQMPIHVPLSEEAQAEARVMMLASNNILNPRDGKPVAAPSQDMVLGNYYITMEVAGEKGEGKVFKDVNEAQMAYDLHDITLHTRIAFKADYINQLYPNSIPAEHLQDYLITTFGKIIFNRIPSRSSMESFPYLNDPEGKDVFVKTADKYFCPMGTNIPEFIKKLDETRAHERQEKARKSAIDQIVKEKEVKASSVTEEEINEVVSYDALAISGVTKPFNKGFLKQIVAETFKRFKSTETSKMLDRLKDTGFKYCTKSGITVCAFDITLFEKKREIVAEAQKEVDAINENFDDGEITAEQRYREITGEKGAWNKAKDKVSKLLIDDLKANHADNHTFMMYDSGARGSESNYTQLAGMRGLMFDTKGRSIETPVTSCFREGISMREFFISSHGSRKGSTDTALKTADSGYLTRRLVDVSQDVVVREYDCGTDKGMFATEIKSSDGKVLQSLRDRIIGRFTNKEIVDYNTGEVILGKNEYIDEAIADRIDKINADAKSNPNLKKIPGVWIRTVCTCKAKQGICVKCYGRNMATSEIVEVGEAVGIIASQAIGEPGTQLTMRTFHTGGIAGDNIVSGLPRVTDLFEMHPPKAKDKAEISMIDGVIDQVTDNAIVVKGVNKVVENGKEEYETYTINIPSRDKIISPYDKVGTHVNAGDAVTKGHKNVKELLKATNIERVQEYIIQEVQKVYAAQSVPVNDKHVEIIVHQMTKRLVVKLEGDTDLLPGQYISANQYADANREALLSGKKPAVAVPILLGITKAALRSDSWLSAASFQETTRVLTEAAIRSQVDHLRGLKENVIIGGLIPAGTGILKDTKFQFEGREEQIDDFGGGFHEYDN